MPGTNNDELEALLALAGGVPPSPTDFASNMGQMGADNRAQEEQLADIVFNMHRQEMDNSPGGGVQKLNPYQDAGPLFRDAHGGSLAKGVTADGVPMTVDPYNVEQGGNSKTTKTKGSVSTEGYTGPTPGNTDPYQYDPDMNARDTKAAGVANILDSANMQNEALDAAGMAAAEIAQVNQRELKSLEDKTLQEAELIGQQGDDAVARRQERAEMAAKERKAAEDRWNGYMKQVDEAANAEVDPGRYWNSRSGFQKVMYALGAMASASVQHIYGKNTAMDMLDAEIARDIAAQSDKINRKFKALDFKKDHVNFLDNLGRMSLEEFDEETQGIYQEYMIRTARIQKEVEAIKLKYGADRVGPELLQFEAQLHDRRAQVSAQIGQFFYADGQHRLDQEWQQKENARDRAHQARLQKERQAWEELQADKEFNRKLAIQGGPETYDLSGFGIVSADAEGKPTADRVVLKGEQSLQTDTLKTVEGYSNEYQTLVALKQLVNDRDWRDYAVKSQAEKAKMIELVTARVKLLGGNPSDADVNRTIESIYGASSPFQEAIRSGDTSSVLDDQIERNVKRGQAFLQSRTEAVNGVSPKYDPEAVTQRKGANKKVNIDDAWAELSGKAGVQNPAADLAKKVENPAVVNKAREIKNFIDTNVAEAKKTGDIRNVARISNLIEQLQSDPEYAEALGMPIAGSGGFIAYPNAQAYLNDVLETLASSRNDAPSNRKVAPVIDDMTKRLPR